MKYEVAVYDEPSRYLIANEKACVTFNDLDVDETRDLVSICAEYGKCCIVSCTDADICGPDACEI